MGVPNYDFLLENKLKELSGEFTYRHTCCMALFEQMLKKFLVVFPTFTDHTLLHTLTVNNISNQIIRENINKLNAGEIYIYLMACALHDIGMGVSDKDLDGFIEGAGLKEYVKGHPQISKANLIRKFHNDFSAQFVKKYWGILEIPNQRYAHAIAEVGRGHRKTDLMDEGVYPTDYDLGDGHLANLALLSALIRLCDELDVGSDRNPDLLYNTNTMEGVSEESLLEFSKHQAIRKVEFGTDTVTVFAHTQKAEVMEGILATMKKAKETFAYCLWVIENRSDFKVECQRLKLILNQREVAI